MEGRERREGKEGAERWRKMQENVLPARTGLSASHLICFNIRKGQEDVCHSHRVPDRRTRIVLKVETELSLYLHPADVHEQQALRYDERTEGERRRARTPVSPQQRRG